MPTTISAGFAALRSNIEITGLQKSTVSTRQNYVRKAVANGFDILDSFLSGSYSRSTMISPLKESDVDIFVVLESKYYAQYTPASLLDRLKAILKKTYPTTPQISRNGQAVTISFTDFNVDVVPGFNRQGGGYIIPNSIDDRWISTNPKTHNALLNADNKSHNNDLVPVVKMIKSWNRCINDAFTGFYLELLTGEVLANVNIDDYPSGVRYVFDKGRMVVRKKIADPAGFGDPIAGLNNVNDVDSAVSRFETAYNRALKAEQYESNGNTRLAYAEWEKIFPNYFPAYR